MKFDNGCTRITAAGLQLTVGIGGTDPSMHGGDFYATISGDANTGWTEPVSAEKKRP